MPEPLELSSPPAREGRRDSGVALPSLTKAALSGEAVPLAVREWLATRGIAAYQSYGTADLGLVAYETAAREGLVVDEGVIVEIVRPGTGDPVADGEVGEVVVTTLNPDYPLIRFGTGDLSAVLAGACPTGRTNLRIKGWMGRADQSTKVRGMFVHPRRSPRSRAATRRSQGAPGRRGRDGRRPHDLHAETDGAAEGLAERIARRSATSPSCAATSRSCARQPAQRRQGDRRPAPRAERRRMSGVPRWRAGRRRQCRQRAPGQTWIPP